MVIASIEPITTTNKIAFSDSPNHNSASGSQQIDGSACRPTTSGPSAALSHARRAISMPSTIPANAEIAYPVNRRCSEVRTARGRLPSRRPSHNE